MKVIDWEVIFLGICFLWIYLGIMAFVIFVEVDFFCYSWEMDIKDLNIFVYIYIIILVIFIFVGFIRKCIIVF